MKGVRGGEVIANYDHPGVGKKKKAKGVRTKKQLKKQRKQIQQKKLFGEAD